MKNYIKLKDLELLSQLIGKKLTSLSGPYLSDSLEGEQIIVSCDNAHTLIQGQVEYLSLAGNTDEFARIEVTQASKKLFSQSLEKGNVYFQNAGGLILDVLICRESIQKNEFEREIWDYETDNAVILVLETGTISISKVSHHAELLKITFIDKPILQNIEETSGRFNSDLFAKYSKKRKLFGLDQLRSGSN